MCTLILCKNYSFTYQRQLLQHVAVVIITQHYPCLQALMPRKVLPKSQRCYRRLGWGLEAQFNTCGHTGRSDMSAKDTL